jgi:hypothetical protein
MATSVRMDPETERLLEELAREGGFTKSEAIRVAIRLATAHRRRVRPSRRPYETFRRVIGVARGGPRDLSERTGERFRQLLAGKGKRS